MTPNEAYESFIIKTNENAQTDNISVDRGRFSVIFNESIIKYVEWILDKKNEDEIRYLQPILKTIVERNSSKKSNYQLFKLPKDFFDLGNISAKATTCCCNQVDFELYEIKVDNQEVILKDEFLKPSAEYREAPYYLENKNVKVFTKDFTVDALEISYYKYPQYIKLIDDNDPESDFILADEPLEFDDKVINRVISIATSDNSLNVNNPKHQLEKNRVISRV